MARAPRVRLRTVFVTPEGKRRYVRRLFTTIADRYDFITAFLSWGQDRRWKRRLIRLAAVRGDDRVLDLACGTGDLLRAAMAARPRRAVGLDLTHRMLVLADRRRPWTGPPSGEGARDAGAAAGPVWVNGDMSQLPFRDGDFDVVTTGYGLRNVPNLPQAVREIHRVLAGGGRLVSLDFNRPENRIVRTTYLAYLTVVGSALGLVLHRDPDTYRYIPESIRHYPGARGVARLLEAEGFVDVAVVRVLFGLMAMHTAVKPRR